MTKIQVQHDHHRREKPVRSSFVHGRGKRPRKEIPMKDSTLLICIAYESGFGHAFRDLCNPYPDGSDEFDAYAYGKSESEHRNPKPTVTLGSDTVELDVLNLTSEKGDDDGTV